MTVYLYIAGGVALLWLGGELLVRHAVRFSTLLGLRPLVVGLTVVAFGTSAPELAASLFAAMRDVPVVALGNVIGSNILNIGVIMGLTATFYTLHVQDVLLKRELPIMIGAGLLLFPLLADGRIGRLDGLVLTVLLAAYIVFQFRVSRGDEEDERSFMERHAGKGKSILLALVGIAAGIVLLTKGADWLVEGAVIIATRYGVSQKVVGITMVAVGTSLPELASSIVAALRHQGDLVMGNLVGSSIFNVLAILGITGLVRPVAGSLSYLWVDLAVMSGFGVLALVLMTRGRTLRRGEGAVMVALYLAYLAWLIL